MHALCFMALVGLEFDFTYFEDTVLMFLVMGLIQFRTI